ncbi:hypothetical protein [Minwuia thermotolerans]|nr:hypothetical protein [Minwuia thermotolerans]
MPVRSLRRSLATLLVALSVLFAGGMFAAPHDAHAAAPTMTVYKSP